MSDRGPADPLPSTGFPPALPERGSRGASPFRLTPLRAAVLAALAVIAWAGWREFWFLTDDAYITFRYVQNSLAGHGYTWNAPPFRPVEGYSNFLWMVLLEGVWRLTGLEPPVAANPLSLAFGLGSLALGFSLAWRVRLPRVLEPHRFALAAAVLLFALTNRTFLAWTSSGLETALFVFCTTLWVVATLRLDRHPGPGALAASCSAAALTALTRPDGLLAVAASVALVAHFVVRNPPRLRWAVAGLPLAAVAVHLSWRRSYYGEWLPNTYYAKQVAPWPEAGLRYAASFVLEYGLWVWLLVAAWAAAKWLRAFDLKSAWQDAVQSPGRVLVLLVLVGHFAYYTLLVGGDHFEYRVYAHLLLPLGAGFLVLLSRLELRPAAAWLLLALLFAASLPIPWVHHVRTRGIEGREATVFLRQPVADAFPAPLRPAVALFDELQAWLIEHGACVRHREHQVFHEYQLERTPPRTVTRLARFPENPVATAYSVGVPGWMFPDLAIIDLYGLNDRVIARHPPPPGEKRVMAHERRPPPGYAECFEPLLLFKDGVHAHVPPRSRALTADRIRACERLFDR